jgi:hypothetical protein
MQPTLLAVASSILLQIGNASPRDLLTLQRPLTAAEMETVVVAVRQVLAGTTLRLVDDRYGSRAILVGPSGLPQMIRTVGESGTERVATRPMAAALCVFPVLPRVSESSD